MNNDWYRMLVMGVSYMDIYTYMSDSGLHLSFLCDKRANPEKMILLPHCATEVPSDQACEIYMGFYYEQNDVPNPEEIKGYDIQAFTNKFFSEAERHK